MKQTVLFSTFLFLVLSSCTNTINISDYTFEDVPVIIDMDKVKKDTLKINYLKYIPLETTDECLIGGINKTIIKNSRIYVGDFSIANALFVFDLNGRFLFKIARMGHGPGEYIRIVDFDIQTNGDIYLYDTFGKKFLVFESNGEYLNTIQMEYGNRHFCLIDNKLYLSKPYGYGDGFASLASYDMNNNKTEILFDKKYLYDNKISDFREFDFCYSPDTVIYFAPKLSKIIFSIDRKGVHPALGVKNLKETPKHTIETWLREEDVIKRSELMMENPYFVDLSYVFENNNYICFVYNTIVKELVLYNKHSELIFQFSREILFSSLGIEIIKGSTGKCFFGVIEFNTGFKEHKKILESREELKNWREDDNPVVVVFNLEN